MAPHKPAPSRFRRVAAAVVLLGAVSVSLIAYQQSRFADAHDLQLASSALGALADATPPPAATASLPPPPPPPMPTSTPQPTRSPQELERLHNECYFGRDFGLIERAARPSHVFCADVTGASRHALAKRTKVTLVDAPSSLRAVVYEDLLLDLSHAAPHKPITSLAQDGGSHDPRFRYHHRLLYCSCDELARFADAHRTRTNRTLNVWDPALAFTTKRDGNDASLVCAGNNAFRPEDLRTNTENLVEFTGKTLLLPRRDDHNPFFQISYALNAWIMLHALRWSSRDVTVVHLDAGYPSPIDELHRKLLAPAREIVRGGELVGKRVLFSGPTLLVPFETVGPMMQHLDDHEPCFGSELFRTFCDESFAAVGVEPTRNAEHDGSVVVTFISRRPYEGRVVQRRWLNEDEVVAQLRRHYVAYLDRKIVFRSVEFVNLSLPQQMQLMLDSDVVIGMHGAGLVNVMWTRPGTLVLEIFPAQRKRWGYRNLCQRLGCDWHEFRGGKDVKTGNEPNANDKIIRFDEWDAVFGPLFHTYLERTVGVAPLSQDGSMDAAAVAEFD